MTMRDKTVLYASALFSALIATSAVSAEPQPRTIEQYLCKDVMRDSGANLVRVWGGGLVETEFSIVRFRGDEDAARKVYEGLDPITPEEVADCVMFALTRPPHVNVDELVIKALAQSSGGRIVRR